MFIGIRIYVFVKLHVKKLVFAVICHQTKLRSVVIMLFDLEDSWRAFCSAEPRFQKLFFLGLILVANHYYCHLDEHHRPKNKSVKE